jgi:hypothetical protein
VTLPTLMPSTAVSVALAGVCAIAGLKLFATATQAAQGFRTADKMAAQVSDSASRFMR